MPQYVMGTTPMQAQKAIEGVRVWRAEAGFFFEGTIMKPLSEETRENMAEFEKVLLDCGQPNWNVYADSHR